MRPQQLLTAALTLSSLSAAWPWPPNMDDMKAVMGIENMFKRDTFFYPRQDNNNDDNNDSTSETASATKNDKSASKTASASDSNKSTAAETASNTGTAKGTDSAKDTDSAKTTGTAKETGSSTGTAKGTGSSKTTKKGKTTSIDARLPAGGISMITPAATDASQYYKIGDWLSFAWNYTSLSVTPTAINVVASCSKNQETYTIAGNLSVHETNKVFWDTGEYEKTATKSLLQETYTLIIYDAGSSVSATSKPGYLGVANTFTFGMYRPQAYVPRSEWICPGCNAAGVSVETQTFRFMFGTFAITVLSFTWFVVGAGII